MATAHEVGVFGATGYAGRELVRLLGAPSLRARRVHHRHRRRATSPTRRGSTARPTPTCSRCPTASPPPTRPACARRSPTRSWSTSPATCASPTPRPIAHWYGHDHPAPALLGAGALRPAPRCTATGIARRAAGGQPRLLRDLGAAAAGAAAAATGWWTPATSWWTPRAATTGAGRAPREDLLFCEVADDFSAYAPGRAHRHVGEMEAVLEESDRRERCASRSAPTSCPCKRGILSALYLQARGAPRRSWPRPCARFYAGRAVRAGRGRAAAALRRRRAPTTACISVHDAAPGPGGGLLRPRQPGEGRRRARRCRT